MEEARARGLPSRTQPTDTSEPGSPIFVWTTLAIMVASALVFVGRYGADVPLWDDFDVVPVAIGERPITAGWLWSQHNEHRVPLPRLVLLASYRLTGGDCRAGMFFNVVTLGVIATGLIAIARALRGGTSYSDAFYPIALLNLGHHANLLWSWQVQFVLSTALACSFLMLIVGRATGPTPGMSALAGTCLTLLPLCGANGLALVPALAFWLSATGLWRWRSGTPQGRRDGLAALVSSTPALLLIFLYYRGYRSPPHHPSPGGSGAVFETTLQFLSLVFGPSAAILWPSSGLAALVLFALSAAALAKVLVREPGERARALGLLCFLAAVGSLAIGLGWGRAGSGPLAGFADRYVTLVVPALCAISLSWQLYGGSASSRLIPMVLFVAMCVLLWPNSRAGLDHGRDNRASTMALRRDLLAGMPPYRIVRRYTPFLHPSQDVLDIYLPMFSRHGIGPFGSLRGNTAFREVPAPKDPAAVDQGRWEGGTATITGPDPHLLFILPEERYVGGIRLRYSHSNRQNTPARFRLSWNRAGQAGFPPEQSYANWFQPTGPDRSTTIWIDEAVKRIRIQPDNQPCEFRISEFTLLVP